MRTPVHPDRARLLVGADVVLDRDELLRVRIALFPDPELQRTSIYVGRDVHLALMLGQRQSRRIPAERPLPRAVGDRQAEIVAELGAGNALGLIFIESGAPAARQVNLRVCRRRCRDDRHHDDRSEKCPHGWVFYSTVNGTDTFVVAHAIAMRPPGAAAFGSMVKVSCSTVAGSFSFCIFTRPRSYRER